MKILYDSQIFELQKYGGISRYFVNIAENYNDDISMNVSISAKISNNEYLLNSNIDGNFVLPSKNIINKKYNIERKFNSLYCRFKLFTNSIDIFHPTYYDPDFLNYIGKTPFILTIYDMVHEKFSDMISEHDKSAINKKLLAKKASKIIAISESTKKDIIDILGIDESKIDVIYLGSSMKPTDKVVQLKNLPSKYILFVGNRAIYKNFNKFIEAISPLIHENFDLYVVCVGGGEFSEDEKNILSKLNISEKVYQYDIDDSTLAKLYSTALVFVFPSLYEGFGIPILEAFSCDCPIVCSNTSSFPEIAGNAAVYFDPMDKISILTTVTEVVNNNELRKKLVQSGRERLKMFSWDITAQKTKKVYENTLLM